MSDSMLGSLVHPPLTADPSNSIVTLSAHAGRLTQPIRAAVCSSLRAWYAREQTAYATIPKAVSFLTRDQLSTHSMRYLENYPFASYVGHITTFPLWVIYNTCNMPMQSLPVISLPHVYPSIRSPAQNRDETQTKEHSNVTIISKSYKLYKTSCLFRPSTVPYRT